MKYTIAAIPTLYGARKYRSRLEAQWAAFFDLLGWRYEYEPFDLGKWSPDFLLFGYGNHATALVEIKPITEFDASTMNSTMNKITTAQAKTGNIVHSFVFGVSPFIVGDAVHLGWRWHPSLWDRRPESCWQRAPLFWSQDEYDPVLRPDIAIVDHFTRTGWGGLFIPEQCGPYGTLSETYYYSEYTMKIWAKASNIVQWEPSK